MNVGEVSVRAGADKRDRRPRRRASNRRPPLLPCLLFFFLFFWGGAWRVPFLQRVVDSGKWAGRLVLRPGDTWASPPYRWYLVVVRRGVQGRCGDLGQVTLSGFKPSGCEQLAAQLGTKRDATLQMMLSIDANRDGVLLATDLVAGLRRQHRPGPTTCRAACNEHACNATNIQRFVG